MKKTSNPMIFTDGKKLYTKNPENCIGTKVYNENIKRIKNVEYRSWNPYRSKISAAMQNGFKFEINKDYNVLYLGAATGTTVSHFSDILTDGIIYAVEKSAISMKKLLDICRKRKNIIPLMQDAYHPDRYQNIVGNIDLIYQDISQRNQAEIFIKNIEIFLKKDQKAILMVKARSIDVSKKPDIIYNDIIDKLKINGLKIIQKVCLKPYEKDHMAIKIIK